MESGDLRAQLPADSREGMVNKILDTLKGKGKGKGNLPFYRHEELQELKNIAERIEDEIYTATTSQSKYLQKICFMMLTMETKLQNLMLDPVHSNSAALYKSVNPSVPLDSTASDGDWQDEVYQKMKAMKDLYLLDLNDMHQKLLSKLQQNDSLLQQPENELLKKLKLFKNMLERFMQFLQIPKHEILANYKDKLGTYERQSISVVNSNKRAAQQQSQALPPQHMQSLQQSQQTHSNNIRIKQENQESSANLLPTQVLQSHPQLQQQVDMQQRLAAAAGGLRKQNVMDIQKRLCPQKRATAKASSNSAAQTDNPNGGDWQEEVYEKIKVMKDLYLLDLNDMHQKSVSKLQQHNYLPQQPNNKKLEQLKVFKNMLERFMQFLQIPKRGILPIYKEKLGTYEKHIINVINSNRRKPAAPQQQAQSHALPPQHMRYLQQSQQTHSQLTQVQQSHPQLQQQVDMQQRLATAGGLQKQNVIDMQKRLCPQKRATPEASSTQTDNPNGRDWQEEVYQKGRRLLQRPIGSHDWTSHLISSGLKIDHQREDMDTSNGSPTQVAGGAVGDPTTESGDWRAQLAADSRERITYKILDTLKRHLPYSGDEGLEELKKIAVRFEEKVYTAATSQSDYLQKIPLKMLTMETRSQNPISDPMQSNSAATSE
ncbi:putative coactivator CBP, KIX domain superfamily, mediator complex subunit 15, KIX [Helianthus debilis subsp. tardiflorus]